MSINDKERAVDILLDKGYYRLGFYWFPMEKSYPSKERRNHNFKDGASFDKSVRLYEFDKELRNILSYYIHDIEVNLRTKVIYYVSNEYKNDPVWFVNNDIVMGTFIDYFIIKYNDDIKKNDVISRHHTNHPDHQYAPAWKTLEYISFGDLIRLIDNLKDSDLKKKIYNQYGLSEDKTFANYIDVVRKMRNNCAHGKLPRPLLT